MPRFAKYEEGDEPVEGYRLVDFLGAGQFGEVWKAQEIATKKLVAIKLIDLSHSSSALKELKALNLVINLNHPNLVPIYTARLKDKNGKEMPLNKAEEIKQKGQLRELVIAMGLGERSLSARLKQLNPDGTDPDHYQGIPLDELVGYMQGAAKGIDYLNKADHGLTIGDGPIIHCDIKPDNMMIVSGEVQIADCGVAVIITPDARQTKAAGSPAYSAPELTGNKPVPGTDQYALAISYYELRTGKLPFDEQMGQLSIMLAHAEGRLDFSSPVISEDELKVLRWATAVQPRNRYASCSDMVRQLIRAAEGLSPLEPSQVVTKSASIPVPAPRQRVIDPGEIRATPQLPVQEPGPQKGSGGLDLFKSTDDITFELPEKPDDLRGTVIPNSDRYLPPSDPGFLLPTPTPTQTLGRETKLAQYENSASEILIPATPEENYGDVGTTPPPATPAPVAAAAQSSPMSLGTLNISRPEIYADQDDPMGPVIKNKVGLAPEIAEIIKEGRASSPVKPPTARTPSVPPPVAPTTRPPSNPVIVPPTAPGRKSTQYPRETPDEPEEKSLPPWAKEEERSLPPWAKEAERERQKALSQSSVPEITTASWKPPAPAPAGGVMKYVAGGLVGVGVIAGGVFLAMSGSSSSGVATVPPPPPPNVVTDTVDLNKVEAIDNLIANKDYEGAEKAAKELAGTAYLKHQEVWKKLIENGRKGNGNQVVETLDAKMIREIETLIKSDDAESFASARKLANALSDGVKDRRDEFSKSITAGELKLRNAALDKELAKLDGLAVADTGPAAEKVIQSFSEPDQQKKIGHKLVAIGQTSAPHRATVTKLLTDQDRFSNYVDADDRKPVFAWKAADLETLASTAKKAVEALGIGPEKDRADDIKAAQKAVTDLKRAVETAGKPFGTAWKSTDVPPGVQTFLRTAEAWSAAREKPGESLKDLARLLKDKTPPILPVALAKEYLRIADAGGLEVRDLRDVRDKAGNWGLEKDQHQEIDALFQNVLAARVLQLLARADAPNFGTIATMLSDDHANGWAKAVAAEKAISEKKTADAVPLLKEAEAAKVADATAEDRKAYIGYVRSIATRDPKAADTLVEAYKNSPSLLTTEGRKKATAEVLWTNARAVRPMPLKLEDVFAAKANPYKKDERALKWLKKADELTGKMRAEWVAQLALLAMAGDDQGYARELLADRPAGDESKLDDADVPAAVALNVALANDPDARVSQRIAAYAAGSRLAYRWLEFSFGDCTTSEDVNAKSKRLVPEIVAFALAGRKLADENGSGKSADSLSLRLSLARNEVLTKAPNPQWQDTVVPELEAIARDLPARHPDEADAHGLLAYATLMRFRATDGNLRDASKDERTTAWSRILQYANKAVALDPKNNFGNRVIGFSLACEYGQYPVYKPPMPFATDAVRDISRVTDGVAAFERACEALKTRKNPAAWLTRGNFLFVVANDLAKAGESKVAIKYFQDAATCLRTADEQNPKKYYEESKSLGCILEDLAWLGRVRPQQNYAEALLKLKNTQPDARDAATKIEGRWDFARCLIRAIEYGHVGQSRLTEAAAALDEIETSDDPKARSYLAKAKHWRGNLHRVAKQYADAERAFAAAVEANLANQISEPLLIAVRAETALDGLAAGVGEKDVVVNRAEKAADQIENDAREHVGFRPFTDYLPDYLRGRAALANGDPRAAATQFARAFRKIKAGVESKELRVEMAFPFSSIALELSKCAEHLSPEDRKERQLLLSTLEERFGFALTPHYTGLIKQAK